MCFVGIFFWKSKRYVDFEKSATSQVEWLYHEKENWEYNAGNLPLLLRRAGRKCHRGRKCN